MRISAPFFAFVFCFAIAYGAHAVRAQNALPDIVAIPASVTAPDNALPPQPATPPGVDVLPAQSLSVDELDLIDPDEPTHPNINMTPDKSEIVRLDADAATVIVGNPSHLSVLVENTRTLVLASKIPGASYFTVLDHNGNIVMQRHVIVASPQQKYMRIRKSCSGVKGDCKATQVYYCPDMCHEINLNTGEEKSSTDQPGDAPAQPLAVPETETSTSGGE
jgi:hypothetical protein